MKILKMSVAEAATDDACPRRDGCSEIVRAAEKEKGSSVPECFVDVNKVHLDMVERNCRICHLSMDTESVTATPIQLGCSCKNDLAAAHKHCAEVWFKIKGNKICEICGSIARNVAGVVEVETTSQWNEANNDGSMVPPTGAAPPAEAGHFWQGHWLLNFLLACMAFAFLISWLFHLNKPS